MKDAAVVNQAGRENFSLGQAGICAGFAGKAEFTISGIVQGDEGQRGEHVVCHDNPAGVNAKVFQRANEQLSQCICSHLAQHGGGTAVGLQGSQKIAGRAAGIDG